MEMEMAKGGEPLQPPGMMLNSSIETPRCGAVQVVLPYPAVPSAVSSQNNVFESFYFGLELVRFCLQSESSSLSLGQTSDLSRL